MFGDSALHGARTLQAAHLVRRAGAPGLETRIAGPGNAAGRMQAWLQGLDAGLGLWAGAGGYGLGLWATGWGHGRAGMRRETAQRARARRSRARRRAARWRWRTSSAG